MHLWYSCFYLLAGHRARADALSPAIGKKQYPSKLSNITDRYKTVTQALQTSIAHLASYTPRYVK